MAAEKKDMYEKVTYQQCLDRIARLSAQSQPLWGKMNVAQMLAHCAEIQEVSNGTRDLQNTPFIVKLFKGMVRKIVVGDKPYDRNSRTHPQYIMTSGLEFDAEKKRLLEALEVFFNKSAPDKPHPLFGEMTTEEKGWAMYKHLNHHLEQFGV